MYRVTISVSSVLTLGVDEMYETPMGKNKDDQLHIRLSTFEKRQIEAAAQERGLPVSTWLRILALREAGIITKAA